ncbi:uncharacterized protein LOC133815921 isoform X2 [Humulus lupulus]|uniref:uncharacterized protein LOC133792539 n=1 Tax=Humulus lupulus TaxID=3486 RepID=UPI002B40B4AC|nr:uncharacterized protein LOC133792539 [Humulus lupulus]XP_062102254.1 uncharacterized protein LOC133812290 [Humulus lupulus]XP_062104665.1 uncharacterized protein LOC133815921 isoform X2 [Humulus lupulus]
MSADIATSHGGDGGGLDPPDPSRVPSSCESAEVPRRKGRGLANSKPLEIRRRNAGKPLDLQLDPRTDKVVGLEDQAFVREIGLQVTLLLPGHYLDFADVPQQFKEQVVQRMKYFYNVDGHPEPERVMKTIYTEMRKRYSERKNIRHTHFKKYYSNPEDLQSVLVAPPDHCSKESWKDIVQLFLSPKFIARSNQNKKNRKEMKYTSTQGTKSMAAKRHQFVSKNINLI